MSDINPNDRVTFRAVEMESIPVGANPFLHDYFSMGTQLVRGWWAMHDGYDSKDDPKSQFALRHLYLYNERSGQRIRLEILPQQPQTAAECLERVQRLTGEIDSLLQQLQQLVDKEVVA